MQLIQEHIQWHLFAISAIPVPNFHPGDEERSGVLSRDPLVCTH